MLIKTQPQVTQYTVLQTKFRWSGGGSLHSFQTLYVAQKAINVSYSSRHNIILMADNIKIVVRVRPFNDNQKGQKCIVQMDDNQVNLTSPEHGEKKQFAFHRCYWSTDNSQGTPPVDNKFVFNDIGKQILEHTYQGYNSTIFAYGQTGSGKSYSIEGYPPQKGLLQLCCEDIFSVRKAQNATNGVTTTVQVSYLEIYNEKLRDLLNPSDEQLKIMSSGTTVFIQGLSSQLCESYAEVEKLFYDGKKIRVIGAHAMNKNSSRSHAVFTIYYKEVGKGKIVQSKFNIVDLAGSERQSKTGATGVRLEQANNINKSLTNLGIVIQALANNCQKKTNSHVPYRNSQLTHLLSQSLAGNSKTFMIAAISPASSNYQQTLSTLRFAQRVASITTVSKKNVEQKFSGNKQLMSEIERLKAQLEKVKIVEKHSVEYVQVENKDKIKELEDQLRALLGELANNKGLLDDLEKRLEEERLKKLEMEKNRNKALQDAGFATDATTVDDKKYPYLMNISDDPTLAGMLLYNIKQGQTNIGTSQGTQNQIKINSLGMHKRHCTITSANGQIFIEPKIDAKVIVNGATVIGKKKLKHLDRIILGHANAFKLIIPGAKANANVSIIKYGEFLDDKLNNDTTEAKNMKAFIEELQERLDKDTFARFLQNFKSTLQDIDQANQYTQMRYKKYPLKQRNLFFQLNCIIDVNKYLSAQPQLIIQCKHKQTKQVQFIWSQQKFQSRLYDMYQWYSDVDSKNQQSTSTFYEFDPWFEITDQFMKEREAVDRMNPREQLEHWKSKLKVVSTRYEGLIKEQKDLLKFFKDSGIKSEDEIEEYADFFFREFEVGTKKEERLRELNKKPDLDNKIRRFMECCAEIQQCNIDNKEFSKRKQKYETGTVKPTQQQEGINAQQEAIYVAKIEQLKEQITKKIKIIKQLQAQRARY